MSTRPTASPARTATRTATRRTRASSATIPPAAATDRQTGRPPSERNGPARQVRHTVNIAIVAALTLGAATVALAVASTARSPRTADIPVMITDRATTSIPSAAAPSAGGSAGSRTMTAAVAPPHVAKKPGTSEGQAANPRSSNGSSGSTSGRSTGGSSGGSGSGANNARTDRNDEVEVVKPPVQEEDESSDGYNPEQGRPDSD